MSQPRYPHSVVLRTLAQTGLIGTALLVAFLAAAVSGLWPRLRRGPSFARGVAGAGVLVFAYWLVHGAIDWFWEIPVLGAPAFAFLAVAIRTGEPTDHSAAPLAPRWRLPATFALVAMLSQPWRRLRRRGCRRARSTARRSPGAPIQPAHSPASIELGSLNPLSDEPDVIASVIASLVGPAASEQALRRALERNPTNWYPMVELAALEGRRSRPRLALAWLRRAETLNPRESTIPVVRQAIEAGRPSRAELRVMYVNQATLLTGRRNMVMDGRHPGFRVLCGAAG